MNQIAPVVIKEPSQIPDSEGSGNFRLWLQADIQSPEIEVCFTLNSGHSEG